MAKHRPTDAEIVDLLNLPHFNRSGAPTPSTDPIEPTPMRIAIDDIVCYDHNPRRCENSEYEKIRDSMLASGMDQTLSVTRRPGDPHYMIGAGGNTRLRIAQEIWRETQDSRFAQLLCMYLPWRGEDATLIAHLKENDLRGDLTLIDRALAVRELRELLQANTDETLSLRGLSEALKSHGYSVGRTMIQRLDYAVDVLHPAIPVALEAGMGSPQIERLRAIDRAISDVWTALDLGDRDMARSVFIDVLSRYDGPLLDFDGLRRALETELSVTSDLDVQRVSLMFGAAMSGRPLSAAVPDDDGYGEQTPPWQQQSAAPAASPASGQMARPEPPSGTIGDSAVTTHDRPPARPAPTASSSTPSMEPPEEDAYPYQDPDQDPGPWPRDTEAHAPVAPTDLKSLRARAWTLAQRFALRTSIASDAIISIKSGMGFMVLAVEISAKIDVTVYARTTAAWWSLAMASQQFCLGSRALDFLPGDLRGSPFEKATHRMASGESRALIGWLRSMSIEDQKRIAVFVPSFDGVVQGDFFINCDEAAWRDWVDLTETCRAIMQATGGTPWADSRFGG